MSIFVSCGEVSGDIYAASLIRELSGEAGEKTWGVLGPLSVAEGGEAVWSYEELKLMGITEVIPAIPRILRLRDSIAAEIVRRNPSAVVVVDSADFHFSLVKKIRRAGYRGMTVYLVTPAVWAWRSGRTKLLRDYFDLCLPLFSFEHDFLAARGVNSKWAVHPLADRLAGYAAPAELAARYRGGRVIALMAGSRRYDIKYHLTQLIGTAKLLRAEGFIPLFSIAPGLSEHLKAELRERTAGFERWEGEGLGAMAVSEAVAGVSGTVSVEAMLLRRFMVVIYSGAGLSWLIARALVRIPYVSIPNYLTDAPICPELFKNDATPENIVRALHEYLDDPAAKAAADRRMEDARKAMGTGNAANFWRKSIHQGHSPWTQ